MADHQRTVACGAAQYIRKHRLRRDDGYHSVPDRAVPITIMCKTSQILRRFGRSTRGVAAIEFAAILPVLAIIFLATFDGGRAIAAYMKVRAATYALASITNQYSTIASTDMSSILGASSVIMAPYNSTTPVVTVSQIEITSSTNAIVEWS